MNGEKGEEKKMRDKNRKSMRSMRRAGKTGKPGKKGYLLCVGAAAALLLGGCAMPQTGDEPLPTDDEGNLQVGSRLTVAPPGNGLELLESNSALSSRGMYYATWAAGDPEPYENSDGENVDLYDLQLYLLAEETGSPEEGEDAADTWMDDARENYDVQTEETQSCNGQDYTVLTYDCIDPDTPYDRGVSAFTVSGDSAVCIELTCVEAFQEDLGEIMTEFLECCTYSEQQ